MKLTAIKRRLVLLIVIGGTLYGSAKSYGDDSNTTIDILERAGIITHEQAEKARQLAGPPAPAAPSALPDEARDKKIEDLEQEVGILKRQREVDEEAKATAALAPKPVKTSIGSWVNEMRWYGDIRLRLEDFENPSDWTKSPGAPLNADQPDRIRYRVRLRLGVDMKVQDWADFDVRLATGDSLSGSTFSGTSENTTFGNSFRKKAAVVDLAYVTIHPPAWDWFKASGGIVPQPYWNAVNISPMFYKSEVTPQGLTEQLNHKFGDYQQFRVFANLGQFVITEQAGSSSPATPPSGPVIENEGADAYLFDSQAGIEANLDPVPLKLTAAVGFFGTDNLGKTVPGDSASQGNSLNVNPNSPYNGAYLSDFHVLNGQGEVAWTINPKPFLGTPPVLTLGGEFLKNASHAYENAPGGDYTEAWGAQAVFGQAKTKGQWQVGYEYKRLEANSTWDAIVDDNFSVGYGGRNAVPGNGTDIKGHIVNATYNLFDWWQLSATAYLAERISPLDVVNRPPFRSHPISPSGDLAARIIVDSTFKF